jgi:hypothetical protein
MPFRFSAVALIALIGAVPGRAQPAPHRTAVFIAGGVNAVTRVYSTLAGPSVGPSVMIEVGSWPGRRWLSPKAGFSFHAAAGDLRMARLELAAVVAPTATGVIPYASAGTAVYAADTGGCDVVTVAASAASLSPCDRTRSGLGWQVSIGLAQRTRSPAGYAEVRYATGHRAFDTLAFMIGVHF